MEYKIREQARSTILSNQKLMAELQLAFNRGFQTIRHWVNNITRRNNQITSEEALQLIQQRTGLTREEIIEPVGEEAKVA